MFLKGRRAAHEKGHFCASEDVQDAVDDEEDPWLGAAGGERREGGGGLSIS